jgi:hypothetical protein
MNNNLTEFITVQSSVIKNVWYKPSLASLVVDYNNGSSYEYLDVPYFVFEGFRSAESKGRFINKHIKTRFEFKKW